MCSVGRLRLEQIKETKNIKSSLLSKICSRNNGKKSKKKIKKPRGRNSFLIEREILNLSITIKPKESYVIFSWRLKC